MLIAADHFSDDDDDDKRGWADLYAWQLDRGEPHRCTADLHAGTLCRAVGRAALQHARAVVARSMASQLGVARASVVSAYEQLLAEGQFCKRAP